MLRLCVSSKSMTLKTVKKTVRQIPLRLHMRLQKSVLVEMVRACFHLSVCHVFMLCLIAQNCTRLGVLSRN